jgi:Acyl-CoA dehydrogenase, C-terminal domain
MIDADDLAVLAASFEAAMLQHPGAAAADAALHELGWGDLLDAAGRAGAAVGFSALGATGAGACLLDDVIAHSLGLAVGTDVCVVLPAPHRRDPAGVQPGSNIVINGLVSARIETVSRVVVPVGDGGAVSFVEIDAAILRTPSAPALESDPVYRRVAGVVVAAETAKPLTVSGSWDDAVRDARAALAHQLIATSRVMLAQARQHAMDRVQFGKPIAAFQALRHKLAEVLVAIEGAAGVAAVCSEDECDTLTATTAKSLAGKAARLACTNAQQVLAGIGFTTDHQFHLSLKRATVIDTLFGSARTLPSEIGTELLLRGRAPRLVEL